jgi:hypothetical protein
VIDVAAGVLPSAGSRLNAADFRFRVSDTNDLTSWTYAPERTDITVEQGLDGTNHVTITWPDYSIRNQWLQVTMLATDDSGLAVDDVFYFGSLPGDGNGDGSVDTSDFNLWNNDKFTFVDVDSQADFNRDGAVDVSDLNVWLEFRFTSLSLNVAAAAAAAARAPRSALADAMLAAPGSLNISNEAESFPPDISTRTDADNSIVSLTKPNGREKLAVDMLMSTYLPRHRFHVILADVPSARLGIERVLRPTLNHAVGEYHRGQAVERETFDERSSRRRLTRYDSRRDILGQASSDDSGQQNDIRDLLFAKSWHRDGDRVPVFWK